MRRRSFIRGVATGILAAPSIVRASHPANVIVVGAGAAGLTAAYHLKRQGFRVTLLEGAETWGGRVSRLNRFADFPIDLGAEWIHEDADVLGLILGLGRSDMGVRTINYQPKTYQFWTRGKLRDRNDLSAWYAEVKFLKSTWYGFFEKHVLPSVRADLVRGAEITKVGYSRSGVVARSRDGRQFEAAHIVLAVPLSILKAGRIAFEPGLPKQTRLALKRIEFGNGFKMFMKFRRRFYPDIFVDGPVSDFMSDSWKSEIFYDASFGKPTQDNILALFSVSPDDMPRVGMSQVQLVTDVLAQLDRAYGGQASDLLQKAHVQNWNRAPLIQGSYSMHMTGGVNPRKAFAPIEGRIFFAGEYLGGSAQSTVHGAAFSAIRVVEELTQS